MIHRALKTIVVALTVVMFPAVALAQTGAQDDAGSSSPLSSTSTTTTTTAVTVGGILLTVVTLTPGASSANLQMYLQHNKVALLQDTTLGGGKTVRDLAQAFAIPESHVSTFGRLLKRRRQDIRALIGGKTVSRAHASAMIHMIYKEMTLEPALHHAVKTLSGR